MVKPGYADTILQERPGSKVRSNSFDPLHSTPVAESEPALRPGYQLYRQRGGQELSLMLEMANGDILAPEYTYLVRKEFAKSEGKILLHFTDGTIILKGRNLKEVFLQLCRHSVANITEIPLVEDNYPEEETIVHQITTEVEKI